MLLQALSMTLHTTTYQYHFGQQKKTTILMDFKVTEFFKIEYVIKMLEFFQAKVEMNLKKKN